MNVGMSRLVVAFVAGCTFTPGTAPSIDAPAVMPTADAAVDAAVTWRVVETLMLPTCCTASATMISSSMVPPAGVSYRLRVSGTFICTFGGEPADAEYWNRSPMDFADAIDFGVAIDDVLVDGAKTPRWGAYSAASTYETTYVGTGQPLRAILYDSQYDNNKGNLVLEILEAD